jgi:ribosomal protein S18 acetylase RimI-like enzyme
MSRTACLDGKMSAATIRRATAEDVDLLGIIGPAAYAEAYGYLWDRPDAYSDQLRTFDPRAFESLLARPEARVWIGEAGGTILGFLSMIIGSVDPIERRRGGAEIPRIYIIGPAQRTGVGRLLLDAAIRQATTEGLSHIWLDVMVSATAARRAYAKWDFREIGRRRFEKPHQGWPIRHGCSKEPLQKRSASDRDIICGEVNWRA